MPYVVEHSQDCEDQKVYRRKWTLELRLGRVGVRDVVRENWGWNEGCEELGLGIYRVGIGIMVGMSWGWHWN